MFELVDAVLLRGIFFQKEHEFHVENGLGVVRIQNLTTYEERTGDINYLLRELLFKIIMLSFVKYKQLQEHLPFIRG